MKVVVAIPCLNEAATIANVIERLPKRLEGATSITALVIDDGSSDQTASIARSVGASVISHGVNKGLGTAFRSIVEHSLREAADVVVTVDGDGQFDVSDIQKLITPIIEGTADMVTASRFISDEYLPEGIPRIKLWGNRRMSKLISSLVGQRFYDVSCGFRAYSRNCLLNLNLFGNFTYTQETFLDLTYKKFRIIEIPTRVRYFKERQSRVAGSIFKYAVNTSKIIFRVYRDYYPLKFFWILGGLTGFVGSSLGLYFLVYFFRHERFYGALWAGLLSGFLIAIAILLFIMGLVVDLLDRIRINQERMLALVKEDLFYRK